MQLSRETRHSVPIRRLPGWWATLLIAVFAAPVVQAQAQVAGPSRVGEYACPPVPEVLLVRRAASGEPPLPTPADLEAYRQYSQVLAANDWAYLCRYRDENLRLTAAPRPRVVLFGDSITENWKQRDPALFTEGVIDRGVSGQTTPQMLVRFYQDVIALHPRVVHILAGTNDIAGNTGPTSDAQFQDNIRAMVDLARANGIAIILASIPPAASFPWKPELRPAGRIDAWNAWLRTYAQQQKLVFVDYHAVLADSAGGLKPEFGTDAVHPSHVGYRQMDAPFRRALAQAEAR
ncbi:SGNH/GDSL hydrolase family protein [Sphingomonas sp. BIUV-7]|uniref:SGNH/GDSL hydrolase family protein n=1 Tax=Sphingomonas natans TaxID=3063330 RepID=A0ABT8YD39_9SPHN|nr:SGNH/GDSL hydrolase family protein [Sphingomonas sp. BIUV-7]MDO6416285.1 SGNH/GDSL hydrolase family protein [Sphingomonas sp. BIUV-7]